MKTKTQPIANQPKHTQGELATDFDYTTFRSDMGSFQARIHNERDATILYVYGSTAKEAAANAQRIVKAVNAFDAMKSALYQMNAIGKCNMGTENTIREVFHGEFKIIDEAFKQAEQK